MEKGFIDPKLQAQHRVPPGSNGSARPEDENHRDVFEDWAVAVMTGSCQIIVSLKHRFCRKNMLD